ncbi:hypothetical protein [Nocardia noduli]|uniref:hypothetical protein n=1 Tax=Nocardia noduli TaxID=2815722 RepID=UPI001C21C20E|nr:hypothetical protein [Nocardia noduli]
MVDGEGLPTTPWHAVRAGAARDIAVLIGRNRDECRLFLALSGTLATIDDAVRAQIWKCSGPARTARAPTARPSPTPPPTRLCELVQFDQMFHMPALHLADARAAGSGRVHMY